MSPDCLSTSQSPEHAARSAEKASRSLRPQPKHRSGCRCSTPQSLLRQTFEQWHEHGAPADQKCGPVRQSVSDEARYAPQRWVQHLHGGLAGPPRSVGRRPAQLEARGARACRPPLGPSGQHGQARAVVQLAWEGALGSCCPPAVAWAGAAAEGPSPCRLLRLHLRTRLLLARRSWHSWSDSASWLCLTRTSVRITCHTQPEKACLQGKKPLTSSPMAPAALQFCRSWHCYGLKTFQEKPKQAHLTLWLCKVLLTGKEGALCWHGRGRGGRSG